MKLDSNRTLPTYSTLFCVFTLFLSKISIKFVTWNKVAQNGRSCIRRKMTKIVYPNLHVDIGCLANWCFKHLPQVRSSPAHFCGELRRGIKFNQFSTQKHLRMFPRIAYKEIKIDKILQDLPFFHCFAVESTSSWVPEYVDGTKSIEFVGASSTDYHPCDRIIHREPFKHYIAKRTNSVYPDRMAHLNLHCMLTHFAIFVILNFRRFVIFLCCFCYAFVCICLLMPCGGLVEKGLTSWPSFAMSNCEVVTFPLVF